MNETNAKRKKYKVNKYILNKYIPNKYILNKYIPNKYYIIGIGIVIALSLYDILKAPLNRYFLTKKLYKDARNIADRKNKKLMVIGDPCTGNYFEWVSKLFPNSQHGEITVDLYGCAQSSKFDINDLTQWKKFNENEYVVIESGVFSYATNMSLLLDEIKRISGGEFLSAGGTNGFFWEHGLYKTYDTNVKNIIYPFDFRKDKYYKYINLESSSKKTTHLYF
jgi:hypothetical protein